MPSLLSVSAVVIVAFAIWMRRTTYESIDTNAQLVVWLRQNGGWMHPNLTLSKDSVMGNGLKVKGDIRFNKTILKIPRKLWIVPSDFLGVEDEVQSIALAIMKQDCTKDSLWEPYLAVLNHGPPPLLPFTFTEKELSLLQDNTLASLARGQAKALEAVWKTVAAQASAYKSCWTFSNFERWYSIATSHVMEIEGHKQLVPLADMINHASINPDDSSSVTTFASFHEKQGQDMVVRADRTTTSGMLFEEYARLDNSLYLMHFGFVPKDNPHHCSMVSLPPLSTDDTLQRTYTDPWSICVYRDFTCMDTEHLDLYVKAANLDFDIGRDVGSWAQATLREYPTTLDQDLSLLAESDNPRERLAIEFRVAEKEILRHLVGQGRETTETS